VQVTISGRIIHRRENEACGTSVAFLILDSCFMFCISLHRLKRSVTPQQGSRGEVGCTTELRYLLTSAAVLKKEFQLKVAYQFSVVVACLLQIIKGVLHHLAILNCFCLSD